MIPNQSRLKTLLLGLTVILITFIIFVGLPLIVPSFESFNCNTYMLGCSYRKTGPVRYISFIWDEYLYPEENLTKGRLKVEPAANDDSTVMVSGYLMHGEILDVKAANMWFFAFDWKGGLSNRLISVQGTNYYENGTSNPIEGKYVTTGQKGYFSLEMAVDPNAVCFSITATYFGETVVPQNTNLPIATYSPGHANYTDCPPGIEEEAKSNWWIWLIFGLIAAGIVAVLYRYIRKVRFTFFSANPPSVEEVKIKRPSIKKLPESGGDTNRITISFPDIPESLPGVLGYGEVLRVLVELKDKDGNPYRSLSCEVSWGETATSQGITDDDGRITLQHVYPVKGDYMITAQYTDVKTKRKVSSWRTIRIVDYREEMVRLFNDMLETLNLTELLIAPDMTPGEVGILLSNTLTGVSQGSIEQITSGFEEANYSTHPISRGSYLGMYRAIQDVIEYEQRISMMENDEKPKQ